MHRSSPAFGVTAVRVSFLRAAQSLLVAATCSCSWANIHERYHVPGVRDGVVRNYYRIDVTGQVSGTQLRYLSGFFDEDALDRYFNTFTQPNGGALLPVETASGKPIEEIVPTDEKREADPRGLGRKLVLMLSQNSEAIAEQIGAIAQSDAFATVVGRVLFEDELRELEQVRAAGVRLQEVADDADAAALALAARLQADPRPDSGATREQLLLFLNRVAAPLGGHFNSFQAAADWLNANRVRQSEVSQ